jgi:hypothetical protein
MSRVGMGWIALRSDRMAGELYSGRILSWGWEHGYNGHAYMRIKHGTLFPTI